jgi:hypothetical protein
MSELHWLTSSLPRARSVDELRADFPNKGWLDRLEPDYDEQVREPLVVEGKVSSANDIVAPRERFTAIVCGDVFTTGDLVLDSGELGDTSIFVVLGNVRARHLIFRNGAVIHVEGNVALTGYCFGDHGTQDGGAWLHVEGSFSAKGVLNDSCTDIFVTKELRAPVVAGMVHVGAELIRDNNDDIPDEKRFVSDALVTTGDDGRTLDVAKASKLARQGVTFMRN